MESEFRFEKERTEATVTLSDGRATRGYFFVARSSATHEGPERIKDVLNAEAGFFPFEVDEPGGSRTVLFNRSHVVMIALADEDEPRHDPGYDVATRRVVAMRLSTGVSVEGAVRVYRPQGRDRLSDYARGSEAFRYVEAPGRTLIVNVAHVLSLTERIE